jgi:RecG-like helicase
MNVLAPWAYGCGHAVLEVLQAVPYYTTTHHITRTRHITPHRKAPCLAVQDNTVWRVAAQHLPFTLTSEQLRVLGEVLQDMSRPLAMLRCVAVRRLVG